MVTINPIFIAVLGKIRVIYGSFSVGANFHLPRIQFTLRGVKYDVENGGIASVLRWFSNRDREMHVAVQ